MLTSFLIGLLLGFIIGGIFTLYFGYKLGIIQVTEFK